MKKTFILLAILLLMIGFSPSISAQEELPKYQAFYLVDDLVKSSMVPEYELALKDYISLYAEANYPYPVYMYSTNDFHYFYVTPTALSFSALDSIYKYSGKVSNANPEKWKAVWKKFEGTYDYNQTVTIILNRELSYIPKNPRLKPEEGNFQYWVYTYVKVGKTAEFLEILKKWKQLYTSKNISDGYTIYWGALGMEQPVFIWHMRGKDAADFWGNSKSLSEKAGAEEKMLREQLRKLTRKIDVRTGWYRPEFSYEPKKE